MGEEKANQTPRKENLERKRLLKWTKQLGPNELEKDVFICVYIYMFNNAGKHEVEEGKH